MVRLNAAPAFLKDAVMKGVLVSTPAEDGTAAAAKRSRRKLEFRAAVEFMRLHDYLVGLDPKSRENPKIHEKVSGRIAGWVERSLTDGWTVRRVAEHCAALRRDRGAGEPKASTRKPPYDVTAEKLVLHRNRLASLTTQEREALAHQLVAFIRQADE